MAKAKRVCEREGRIIEKGMGGGDQSDMVRMWGGIKLPLVGFGTAAFPYNGERVEQAVVTALEV